MAKRKLNSDEVKLCNRNIKKIQHRNNIIRPKVKHYDAMLSGVLHANYEEQYEEMLNKKRAINQELHNNDMVVLQLQQQIQDGVEIIKEEDKKQFCSECGQEVKDGNNDEIRKETNT